MKIEQLHDASDPRLEDYCEVKESQRLRKRGVFLVEGRTAVRTLLRARRFELRSVLLTEAARSEIEPELVGVDPGFGAQGPRAFVLSREAMDRLAGVRFHQGCIAAARVPAALGLEEILDAGARRLLALWDLSDPDNVGSCFRNALAFGFDAVLLTPGCAQPLYRKAIRTSMGAILTLPFAPLAADGSELERLRERGFEVLGLTPDPDALDLAELSLEGPLVLVLGSEGAGLGAHARAHLDRELRIPMAPGADSLNVAAAGAIAMHRVHSAANRGRASSPPEMLRVAARGKAST